MRLYGWRPRGHGEWSFFVMAPDEGAARRAVDKYVAEHPDEASECQAWRDPTYLGAHYYELTVVGPGEVVVNAND